jgi:hypothetical protein
MRAVAGQWRESHLGIYVFLLPGSLQKFVQSICIASFARHLLSRYLTERCIRAMNRAS